MTTRSEEPAQTLVSKHKICFTEPPKEIPSTGAVDTPLLGNGDIGVTVEAHSHGQRFWLGKNDLWELEPRSPSVWRPGIRSVCWIDMTVFGRYQNHTDKAELNLDTATLSSCIKNERPINTCVQSTVWVAATENVLVIELQANTVPTDVGILLHMANGHGSETSSGRLPDRTPWGQRVFDKGLDSESGVACACRIQGAELGDFIRLEPGRPVQIVVALASLTETQDIKQRAIEMTQDIDIAQLRKAHTDWWTQYWNQSTVELDDSDIERFYYLSLYTMGACSRKPDYPPGLYGCWITTDSPNWDGDYHLNYNHMAPFYALYSANRLEQALPYADPILAYADQARIMATKLMNCRGVLLPVRIFPRGYTKFTDIRLDNKDLMYYFFGQKSNAAYCCVNMGFHWRHSYDLAYAERIYDFVRDTADFWEDYLTWEPGEQADTGRYIITNDSVHEGSGDDTNAILSLGLVRMVFRLIMELSDVMGRDEDRHEKWQHILNHISDFPLQERGGKTVFRYTEKGIDWFRGNTLGIQHIYPAGAIGLDSDPKLLDIARNTIDALDRWVDMNGTNSFYPAAARLGYDPERLLEKMRDLILNHTKPNGFLANNPHGIENCSTVPNTINEMLLQSHERILRFFPTWPRNRNAAFTSLRAVGAFLVSARLQNGIVTDVRITSEQGRPCTVLNPWPDQEVALHRDDGGTLKLSGERFTFDTQQDETVSLQPV